MPAWFLSVLYMRKEKNWLTVILLPLYDVSAPRYVTFSPHPAGFGPLSAKAQCSNLLCACYVCTGVAPHSRRDSLSHQLFLLSMSQLWPSPGLWTLFTTTQGADIQSKRDKWGKKIIVCILFLSFRFHKTLARPSGTHQNCRARAVSLQTLLLQPQELIRATLLVAAWLGNFQNHSTASGHAGNDSVNYMLSCDSGLMTQNGVKGINWL